MTDESRRARRRYPLYRLGNECRKSRHEYVTFDPPFTSVFCRFCGRHPIKALRRRGAR